jgi:hypothetical protein
MVPILLVIKKEKTMEGPSLVTETMYISNLLDFHCNIRYF